MELGMIGLGKMGNFMAQRLIKAGHSVVGFDPSPDARKALEAKGGATVDSLQSLAATLKAPRAVWTMVPSGAITEQTIDNLAALLEADDTVIDGGNSNYKDSMRHAQNLSARKIHFVDCGTSGGVWGLAEGYSMMIGGDEDVVERLRPIFEALAPGKDTGWAASARAVPGTSPRWSTTASSTV